ncbi:hypothetical protein JCGZ_25290 [Jatropha curcas]|uniref:Uncharacterized protein n=1 Tax=Jatropha curcas TaxID=180498 RepID=A0A067JLH4_JATCU|nr:hypothetical protein JCGZ_25290 [Jatropha curcas]
MVQFGNSTLICGSYTSAIFIYSPHRGQEHQIARITLKPIEPSLEDVSSDPTGANKADQTVLSRWPDQSPSSQSNRALKTLSSNQYLS